MLDNLPYNEKELLLKVSQGEEAAFRELFHRYWDNVMGVALLFVKQSEYAEELVQDIFFKIWKNRLKLIEVEDFKNYLFVIARNHIYTALRKKSFETTFVEEILQYLTDANVSPEQKYLTKESLELLNKAVNSLPMQQRMVYELARDASLTHDEIAAKLQISKNTVRNHMTRAVEGIRRQLQHLMMLL